jgi:hypothetical protein
LIGKALGLFVAAPDREAEKEGRYVPGAARPLMSWELRKIRKNGTMLWVRETARAVLRAEITTALAESPPALFGDRVSLQRVLTNLIDKAGRQRRQRTSQH